MLKDTQESGELLLSPINRQWSLALDKRLARVFGDGNLLANTTHWSGLDSSFDLPPTATGLQEPSVAQALGESIDDSAIAFAYGTLCPVTSRPAPSQPSPSPAALQTPPGAPKSGHTPSPATTRHETPLEHNSAGLKRPLGPPAVTARAASLVAQKPSKTPSNSASNQPSTAAAAPSGKCGPPVQAVPATQPQVKPVTRAPKQPSARSQHEPPSRPVSRAQGQPQSQPVHRSVTRPGGTSASKQLPRPGADTDGKGPPGLTAMSNGVAAHEAVTLGTSIRPAGPADAVARNDASGATQPGLVAQEGRATAGHPKPAKKSSSGLRFRVKLGGETFCRTGAFSADEQA
jgi:hypothetical protein